MDSDLVQQAKVLPAAVRDSGLAHPSSTPSAALWQWVDPEIKLKSFALPNVRRYHLLRPKTVNHDRLN